MTRKRIVIVGAGGVARELAWLIAEINAREARFDLLGFVVSDPHQPGATDSRELLLGGYDWLDDNRSSVDCLTVGIGSPEARRRVARKARELLPDVEFPALIHPTARFDLASARLGEGVAVAAGALGTVNLDLQAHVLVGVGATLGHEARIGAWSALNPGAIVSGGVRVGEAALLGSGSIVLQYLSVGDNAVVGAGAVVTRDVAPGTTVVGVPARARKTVE